MLLYYIITAILSVIIASIMTAAIMRGRWTARDAAHRARLEERDRQLQEQKRLLDPHNGQLKMALGELFGSDFERLANRVIDEKTRAFSQQSSKSLELLLKPFREQIEQFRQQHELQSHRNSRGQQELLDKITQTQQMNRQLSDQAEQLTRALRGDSKAQGSWGEVSLQRILEQSGLIAGREYDTQVHIPKDDDGSRLRADVILHLPQKREIVIDAKVSLSAYSRLIASADQDAEYQKLAEAHARSVRNHVKELAEKRYQYYWQLHRPDTTTEEHVLMFVPIEGVLESAIKYDNELLTYAHRNKVMIVNPITMIVLLQALENMWRIDRQSENIEKIFIEVGKIHDKCVNFVDSMEKIGTHISRTEKEYQTAFARLTGGRGDLISSTQKVKELGARTTKQIADHKPQTLI